MTAILTGKWGPQGRKTATVAGTSDPFARTRATGAECAYPLAATTTIVDEKSDPAGGGVCPLGGVHGESVSGRSPAAEDQG